MTAPDPFWWHKKAACRGADPRLFHGPDGEGQIERAAREARAKAFCDRCPVRLDCLESEAWRPLQFGVFGGLGEDERKALRTKRMRAAARASRQGAAA